DGRSRPALVALLLLVLSAIMVPGQFASAQSAPPAAPPSQPGAPPGAAAPASVDTTSYTLTAQWDPAAHQIDGTATIEYQNISSDVLGEIWLKLYLNAFRNGDTVWMRESSGEHRGSDYDPNAPGWITLQTLRLADTGEDILPADIDPQTTSLRVPLPTARAVQPGETVRLEVTWTSQLPRVFARTGYADDFVMAGQWYPKLAVYDRGVWDTEPWHANSEFYADFGTYSLSLTVPAQYVTGATGTRDGMVTNPDGTTTTQYWAESVSDIAWTAWPDYRLATTVVSAAGRPVELELLAPRSLPLSTDQRYFAAAQVALDSFGRWFGPYPWPKLTLVVPPANAAGAGGMEYPMFVTLALPTPAPFGMGRGIHEVEIVTVHEIAHQWSPLQTATNEGREAWLDEGFADYATTRALADMLGPDRSTLNIGPLHVGYGELHRFQYLIAGVKEPLARPSWEFRDFLAYGVTVYSKGSLVFSTLEGTYGEDRFLAAMRTYFDRWRWRHPMTADLQRSLESDLGTNLDWFFQPLVYGDGVVEYGVSAIGPDGATIERRGDVSYPVTIALTYEDGRTERRTWDGREQQLSLPAPASDLRRVQIDPDRTILLEPDILDNAREVLPSPVPLVAVAARVLGFIQAALMAGMIG
ncbi:MAG: M1 family metallopeptidase, partial [Chloroflexota bacterium]